MAILESLRPWRSKRGVRSRRWPFNVALLFAGAAAARLVVPAGAVGAALYAEGENLGLLRVLDAPLWLRAILGALVLDFAIWAQHIAFHRIPVLWALHKLHHTDVDLDATSAGRFHPLEILLSLGLKAGLAVAFGIPAAAVIVYESLLAVFAVLTHANIGANPVAERRLARVVITPGLHRVHHSIHVDESNSNFGTITSIWDRIFGTLRPETREDSRTMTMGVRAADSTLRDGT